jgi:hypothetical protein
MADIIPEREKQPDPDQIVGDGANQQLQKDVKFIPITAKTTDSTAGRSEQLAFNGGDGGITPKLNPADYAQYQPVYKHYSEAINDTIAFHNERNPGNVAFNNAVHAVLKSA